jgi:hypothetical protein
MTDDNKNDDLEVAYCVHSDDYTYASWVIKVPESLRHETFSQMDFQADGDIVLVSETGTAYPVRGNNVEHFSVVSNADTHFITEIDIRGELRREYNVATLRAQPAMAYGA